MMWSTPSDCSEGGREQDSPEDNKPRAPAIIQPSSVTTTTRKVTAMEVNDLFARYRDNTPPASLLASNALADRPSKSDIRSTASIGPWSLVPLDLLRSVQDVSHHRARQGGPTAPTITPTTPGHTTQTVPARRSQGATPTASGATTPTRSTTHSPWRQRILALMGGSRRSVAVLEASPAAQRGADLSRVSSSSSLLRTKVPIRRKAPSSHLAAPATGRLRALAPPTAAQGVEASQAVNKIEHETLGCENSAIFDCEVDGVEQAEASLRPTTLQNPSRGIDPPAPSPRQIPFPAVNRQGRNNPLHRRAARAHHMPVAMSFRKRDVGPLRNPNPMFYPGVPPGLSRADSYYWVWLIKDGWVNDDGTVRSPETRQKALDKLAAAQARRHNTCEAERHEDSQANMQSPGPKGSGPYAVVKAELPENYEQQPNATRQGGLGLDGTDEADVPERYAQQPYPPQESGFGRHSLRAEDKAPTSPIPSSGSRQWEICQSLSGEFSLGTPSLHGYPSLSISRAPSPVLDPTSDPFSPDQGSSTGGLLVSEAKPSSSYPRYDIQSTPTTATPESYPVIVQGGRNFYGPEDQPPAPYDRPWGKAEDPIAKLEAEEAIEAYEARKASGIVDNTPIELTNAAPPQFPQQVSQVEKKSWSPLKTRTRKSSSSASTRTFVSQADSIADSQVIFLTAKDKIPQFSRTGSPARYRMEKNFPLLTFDSNGYLSRSYLTIKLIELFRNANTAPEWAGVIPYICPQRASSLKDPEADAWELYWETMVVKADIRRGCPLAFKAAEIVCREKGGE